MWNCVETASFHLQTQEGNINWDFCHFCSHNNADIWKARGPVKAAAQLLFQFHKSKPNDLFSALLLSFYPRNNRAVYNRESGEMFWSSVKPTAQTDWPGRLLRTGCWGSSMSALISHCRWMEIWCRLSYPLVALASAVMNFLGFDLNRTPAWTALQSAYR